MALSLLVQLSCLRSQVLAVPGQFVHRHRYGDGFKSEAMDGLLQLIHPALATACSGCHPSWDSDTRVEGSLERGAKMS